MDEFAMGSSTENSSIVLTRNPWNTDRVPGGSSGGSAAVVASGQILAALGSDTGGSIRQPAGFCGVVGFKPTYGRISRYGLVAFASSLDQIGPITVDVEDAAILLDIIGGYDPYDSTSVDITNDGIAKSLNEFDVQSLRVGVARELIEGEGISPDVCRVVEKCIEKFESAGAKIIPIELPHARKAVAVYYIIATAEASSNLARFDGMRYGYRDQSVSDLLASYQTNRAQGFGMEVKRRIILGTFVLSSGYYDAYYLRAQKMKSLIVQDFAKAFHHCDVILTPVSPTTAFSLGAVTTPLEMYLSDIFTIPSNLAGNCALSLPAGVDSQGLPVGLQMIADRWQEPLLLKAGNWFMQQQTFRIPSQE
jgi:aspartyl-tRNA(Asn)/glutamyl-tRNA(Gln) amidotransferase subunit A